VVRELLAPPLLLGQSLSLEENAPGAVEDEDPLAEEVLECRSRVRYVSFA
jgi:hypothetical protein